MVRPAKELDFSMRSLRNRRSKSWSPAFIGNSQRMTSPAYQEWMPLSGSRANARSSSVHSVFEGTPVLRKNIGGAMTAPQRPFAA